MNATDNLSIESTLDENWLHELSCVVNFFTQGANLHEETLSKEVKQSLLSIFGAFKEEKSNLLDAFKEEKLNTQ